MSTKVTNQRFFGGSLEMKKEYQKALILLVLEVYFELFFYFLDYCVEPHFPQCKRFKIIFAKCLWSMSMVQNSSFEVFTHLLVKHPEVKLNQAKTYLDCDRCDMVKEILRFRYSRSF